MEDERGLKKTNLQERHQQLSACTYYPQIQKIKPLTPQTLWNFLSKELNLVLASPASLVEPNLQLAQSLIVYML